MKVRIDGVMSSSRRIKGGSPQGTLLGNLLFTITTDRLEEIATPIAENDSTNLSCSASVDSTQDIFGPTLLSDDEGDQTCANLRPSGIREPVKISKFIDDFLAIQAINKSNGNMRFQGQKPERLIWASESEELFSAVERNAKAIGLKINEAKTQLLCIANESECAFRSFIHLENRLESTHRV